MEQQIQELKNALAGISQGVTNIDSLIATLQQKGEKPGADLSAALANCKDAYQDLNLVAQAVVAATKE